MSDHQDNPPLRRRLELGRLLTGSFLEWMAKAYGVGAAAAVALSDSETVGGKGLDAVKAVPTLVDKYREAKYVSEHREQIQAAIDYLNHEAPPREELEATATSSLDTLHRIETTYSEMGQAKDALPWNPGEAWGHLSEGWDAKPDAQALSDLADSAEQLGPLAEQAQVHVPLYYTGLASVMDNFASDEIASTVTEMVVALVLGAVLGRVAGFWVRRGRPGIIAVLIQGLGARVFRRWYVENLPFALTPPLYAAARERIEGDLAAGLVDDPRSTLDPETFAALEEYFAERPAGSSRDGDDP